MKAIQGNKDGGFGLAELLVTTAVLSFVLMFVMPAVAGILESTNEAKPKRDAQALSSAYMAAVTAGSPELQENLSPRQIVELLSEGVNGTGEFADTKFVVAGMSAEDCSEALRFLEIYSGMLVYRPQG